MSGRYTSEQLKKLAMGTMFLDHAAVAVIFGSGLNEMSPLLENIGIAMRLVGRMAFPLYAFLLVQGFMWTRDWAKYVARVAVFAVISEVPFDLVVAGELWYSQAQNTIVTLLVGLVCMKMLEALERQFGSQQPPCLLQKESPSGMERTQSPKRRHRSEPEMDWGSKILGIALAIWVTAAAMFVAEFLRGDYGAFGVLLIVVLYIFRHKPMEQIVAGCLALILIYNLGINVLFAWIAFFFISRYNGERGRKLGMLPYLFYPAHLFAVWLAGVALAGI